jgi:branched-chain amino acid transport system ATP-binding protein
MIGSNRPAQEADVIDAKPTGQPVLRLVGVTAGYGNSVALRDVSFAVQPGQVTVLLGPNGAGKTTVMRTASGTIRPRRGRVELDGEAVTTQPSFRRASLGWCLIPEGRGTFRSLSVGREHAPALAAWASAFPGCGRAGAERVSRA